MHGIGLLALLGDTSRLTAPVIEEQLTVYTATKAPDGKSTLPGVGSTLVHPVDALSLLCWLLPEQMHKAMLRELNSLTGDDGIDERERQQLLAQNAAERLQIEREEEMLVTQGEAQGAVIQRRPACDPRAVLSLSSELPPEGD